MKMKATQQNLWKTLNVVPGGKCISLNAYIKTIRKSTIHDLMMQPKYFGKQE